MEGDLRLRNSRVLYNRTDPIASGGGISLQFPSAAANEIVPPTWVITSTAVLSNAAGITGGGIYRSGATICGSEASIIASNTITESASGGGFALQDGNFTLRASDPGG